MTRLPTLLFTLLFGSALAMACDKDEGDDDHGDDHASEESGAHETGGSQCAELSSVCHDPGEAMGGMAQTCHDVGHEGDAAACAEIYDECIALCTGATSGAESSGSGSTG